MSRCAACEAELPPRAAFCPACGADVGSDDHTVPADRSSPTQPTPPVRAGSSRSSPSSGVPGRTEGYAAGLLLAGRYRIIGLLGRGGMGDVYRADDLTLGQSVALKFLPPALSRDPDRVRRFYQEVRVAREVSHPNVCRVYDVGEVDGRTFLSMEFVDGEDLSSLLRRIGRLPQEKGVEIARQLCAGLAALHERGVVHRDLKPGNVMLDGRGRVRLTDFGLAGLAAEIVGAEVRAGTPAYMAPEQLRGERVDAKSDLFALGLVMYELFTGKRAFEADTPAEIARLHRESSPKSPSTILPNLDPAVERVVARCLEKDPADRPSSAIVVAASLPGGDPLAAALAAGELPSIEMVAAAGSAGGVRPLLGFACLLAAVAGIVVSTWIADRTRLIALDPMEKPPQVLEDRAREILREVGHEGVRKSADRGFLSDGDVLRHVARADSSASRWETLRDARPAAVDFWYRESPRPLIPWNIDAMRTFHDPPHDVPGMAAVKLDTRGRLLFLDVVSPQRDAASPAGGDSAAAPDWDVLFAAAGLDPSAFHETAPEWTPPRHVDRVAAWVGSFSGEEGLGEVRVEAGTRHGKPTYFALYGPWSRPEEQPVEELTTGARVTEAVLVTAIFATFLGGFLLAMRNVRLGRGDRNGARRLSALVAGATIFTFVMTANHTSGPSAEVNLFLDALGDVLVVAGLFWAVYLALEPYVRKTWPERIVGWSRVLTGRLSDPLVGRDILVGAVFFLANSLFDLARHGVGVWRGAPRPHPGATEPRTLLGAAPEISVLISTLLNAVFSAMFFLMLLFFLRLLLRRTRVAMVAYVLLFGAFQALVAPDGARLVEGALGVGLGLLWLLVLVRFGLLAFMVSLFFGALVDQFPMTFDSSHWYWGGSVLATVAILLLTTYGLRIATAGKPLIQD